MNPYEEIPDSLEGLYQPEPFDPTLAKALRERVALLVPFENEHEIVLWAHNAAVSIGHLVGAAELTGGVDTTVQLGCFTCEFTLDDKFNPFVFREQTASPIRKTDYRL